MALSGNLRNFNALQLLALVDKTGKTGSLLLEHWGQSVVVYFDEGKFIKVKRQPGDLAADLFHAGRIGAEQYSLLPPGCSEMAVAETLASHGVLAVSEVKEFAQGQLLEHLHPLFIWTDGTFKMELNSTPEEGDILGSVDLGTALSRVRSRTAEFRKLAAAIPYLDVPIALVPDAPSSGQVCLSAEEWRLVAAMSGPTLLRDLAQRLDMDELTIRKVAMGMTSAGLAELLPSSEPAPEKSQPASSAPEKPQPASSAPEKPQTAQTASDPEPAPAAPVSEPEPAAPVVEPEPAPAEPLPDLTPEKRQSDRSGGGLKSFFKLR